MKYVIFSLVVLFVISCNNKTSYGSQENNEQVKTIESSTAELKEPIKTTENSSQKHVIDVPSDFPVQPVVLNEDNQLMTVTEHREKAKQNQAKQEESKTKQAQQKVQTPTVVEKGVGAVSVSSKSQAENNSDTQSDGNKENKLPEAINIDQRHDAFDALLKNFVSSSGKVNYEALRAKSSALNDYTKDLAENSPESSWSRNERLAYWINAYNAFTLKLICDNPSIKSITDLDGGKPWDRKWIDLGGKTYSLNNIENDIIRPQFNEPRIHFAVNCAAKSCPPLLNKAYTASNLNALLESSTKKFVNNASFNDINTDNIEISKIFEWYAADFVDLISFLNKYSDVKISEDAKVRYKEYNWALNN